MQGGIELATVGLWSKYLMSLDPVAPTATLLAVTLQVRRLSMCQETLDGGTPTQAAVSKVMSVSRPKRQGITDNFKSTFKGSNTRVKDQKDCN